MDEMRIITNNVPRLVIDDYELTLAEREEFDYIDWPAIDRGEASATFFRFKDQLFDLGDCESTSHSWGGGDAFPVGHPFRQWDGFYSDSFFSGTLFKFYHENGREDWDRVIVGWYMT